MVGYQPVKEYELEAEEAGPSTTKRPNVQRPKTVQKPVERTMGPLSSKKRSIVFPETGHTNLAASKYPPASSVLLVGDVEKTGEIINSLDPELVSPFGLVVADIPYLLHIANWDEDVSF